MVETNVDHNAINNSARFDGQNKEYNGEANGNGMGRQMTHEEHATAKAAARFGYGPLAHVTSDETRLPAFGGEFQPGTYAAIKDRKFANPAPLGLCAFALTTFVLGLINMGTRGLTSPSLVIGPAFAYGGLCQLLAGMWYAASCSERPLAYVALTKIYDAGKWPLEILSVRPRCHLMVDSGSEPQLS